MRPGGLSEDPIVRDLEIMSRATNYGAWIYSHFRAYPGQRIIECGAGIGNFTRFLLDRDLVVAADCYAPCLTYLASRFAAASNVVPVQMDIGSPAVLELARYRPDTVVCSNVLEHIQDDEATLTCMHTLLAGSRGRLVLLVPAFQCLYGSIDRTIGHYRRYGKRELERKLVRAGFVIKDLFFMNTVAPLGWFVNNRVLKRTQESVAQVLVFDRWIVPWLSRLERLIRPPFGLSLIAVSETAGRSAAPEASPRPLPREG